MVPYLGDFAEDATVYIMFNTFTSDDPSASCTITNFINTDVHIHKDDGLTQRNNAAGITVSVDFDGITGSHMIKIDTSDNTVAGFWVTGSDYFVRIEGTTVDAATLNVVVGHFSIENRFQEVDVVKWLGQACAAVTVNGVPEVDVTHIAGGTQTVTDLKDFADTGYDPTAHKVQGVVLTDTCTTNTDLVSAADVVNEWETQSQADPTGFHVNVLEIGGTAQTANDNGADINEILTDTGTTLDTLIKDIPTTAEFEARTLPSADYVVTSDTIAGVTTVTNLTNAPTNGDLTATMKASVNTEADTALSDIHLDHLLATDYDPASKPGTATALLNELVESDGGVSRFTANALEEAPTGGSAPTVAEIADGVWDEAQADHVGAGTFGITASEIADILTDTGTTLDTLIKDIPTTAEFEARTLPSADYTVVADLGTVQTGDSFAIVNGDHGLVSIQDDIDEILTDTAEIGSAVGASISADIAAVKADTASTAAWGYINSGIVFRGVVSAADPGVSFTIGGLAGQGAGAFVDVSTPWYAYVFRDAGGAGAAPQGEVQEVTGYTSATGLFTTDAFTVDVAVGDDIIIMSGRIAAVPEIKAVVDDILVDTGTTLDTLVKDIPTNAEFEARTLPSADYVVTSDTIAGVTLCTTCTTNTDMRGTDSAALASVCTEARLSELDAGTAGKAANQIDIIQADTTTDIPAIIATAQSDLDTITGADGVTLATAQGLYAPNKVVPDVAGTAATLHGVTDGKIDTIDGIVDDILVDTAEIGAAGVGLTAVPWNADWDAEVQSECADALTAYDPPTKAEMDTAHALLATPAQVNTQVLDVLNTDTFAEPGQEAPTATTTLVDKIGYLYKFLRNKITNDGTTIEVYNDAGDTVDQKSTVSEAAGTVTRGEFGTGP